MLARAVIKAGECLRRRREAKEARKCRDGTQITSSHVFPFLWKIRKTFLLCFALCDVSKVAWSVWAASQFAPFLKCGNFSSSLQRGRSFLFSLSSFYKKLLEIFHCQGQKNPLNQRNICYKLASAFADVSGEEESETFISSCCLRRSLQHCLQRFPRPAYQMLRATQLPSKALA